MTLDVYVCEGNGLVVKNRNMQSPNDFYFYDNHVEIVIFDRDSKEKERTLVSLCDFERVKDCTWHTNGENYVCTVKDKKFVKLHRYLMNAKKEQLIDHINNNRLDNRRENLRFINRTYNGLNRKGIRGVKWSKKYQKWESIIAVNNKRYWLGYFENFEDALNIRRKAEGLFKVKEYKLGEKIDYDSIYEKNLRPNPPKYPKEFIELAEANGIEAKEFRRRVRRGWDMHTAATKPKRKSPSY